MNMEDTPWLFPIISSSSSSFYCYFLESSFFVWEACVFELRLKNIIGLKNSRMQISCIQHVYQSCYLFLFLLYQVIKTKILGSKCLIFLISQLSEICSKFYHTLSSKAAVQEKKILAIGTFGIENKYLQRNV